MTELETKLGYEFKDSSLLAQALVTPSIKQSNPQAKDNQRLAFLGDAVFGLLSADALYAAFPAEQEGPLTVRRTHLVSGQALAEVAERIGLRRFLVRGQGLPDFPKKAKVLADAMEAVMGAVWLDGGIAAAQTVFDHLELPVTEDYDERRANPRLYVQKIAQSLTPSELPVYEMLSITGPGHAPTITVRVTVPGIGAAEADGRSKAAAEAAAAAAFLEKFGQTSKGRKLTKEN